jgi:serine phosphatase RsbU (regulator of sigma subunit)
MISAKKGFYRSSSRLIRLHFSHLDDSGRPDFLWNSIGTERPDISRSLRSLANFSSNFHTITGLSIYAKNMEDQKWYLMYLSDDGVLRVSEIEDESLRELERSLRVRLGRPNVRLIESDDIPSMYVGLTKKTDVHRYFLKIELGSEGLAAFFHKQLVHFAVFFLIALLVSRLLGYYFARRIAKPIEELSDAAAKVAKGDLSKLVPVNSRDEVGALAGNFNTMIEGLREWERIKLIEFELEKGRQIQKNFLPSRIPQVPNWDIATFFNPAGKVSGDFYDVFAFPDGCMGLVIADVCDKGVGSALYMALFRSLIRVFSVQASMEHPPLGGVMDGKPLQPAGETSEGNNQTDRLKAVMFTNDYIANNHGRECMFATLFFGHLNPATGTLHYINGGHEPPYVIGSSGIKQVLKATGPAVGMMPESNFAVGNIRMECGDVLIGYTDGVTEARSPEDELFSRRRLQFLLEQPTGSASEILERVKTSLFGFIGVAPRLDDVTMLAVQRVMVSGI